MGWRRNKKREQEFLKILFAWYKDNRRDMPWRKTHDPYRILVSEVMLQQTQVARVLLKYRQFLSRYPTVKLLAASSLGDVFREWSGLGYNRRAKYLHECARTVVSVYHGKFPRERKQLEKLPGIGPSTASGVRAFAFGEEDPMIDTNIRRVLLRVFFKNKKISDKELYRFAASLIPVGKGRDWNYAMLDIAAVACSAKSHSSDCPLQKFHGDILQSKKKKKVIPFRQSKRYARGRLMRYMSENNSIDLKQLKLIPWDSLYSREDILSDLIQEGMIKRTGKIISLP